MDKVVKKRRGFQEDEIVCAKVQRYKTGWYGLVTASNLVQLEFIAKEHIESFILMLQSHLFLRA